MSGAEAKFEKGKGQWESKTGGGAIKRWAINRFSSS